MVLSAAYYERFLEHPEQLPERAAFFRDLLEGRAGFQVAARFRQSGWRRPPAEFLDPDGDGGDALGRLVPLVQEPENVVPVAVVHVHARCLVGDPASTPHVA